MQAQPSAVFLIHLIQDVTTLRPLIFMSARDFRFDTLLLVSTKFGPRDDCGIWTNELREIAAQSGARLEYFSDAWEACRHLTGRGLLFAASESNLPQHSTMHEVVRQTSPNYLRITVQHGFECVGFRQTSE